MAAKEQIDAMRQVFDGIKGIDRERLLRPSLGEESLEQSGFGATLDAIRKKAGFVLEYASAVDNSTLANSRTILEQIRAKLDQQSRMNNPQYVSIRGQFSASIEQFLDQLRSHWPQFVSAAVDDRGLLQDEGIRKAYQDAVADMKAQSDEALKRVREESEKTISEARKLAREIEARARDTAAHISVKEAQDEFKAAQQGLDRQVQFWAALSVIAIAAFIWVAVYLARVQFPEQSKWHVVYFTAIRITILTAVGAAATFCMRILRAHMHMSQHNQHRQRVANSMAAFVEAASTPEQRDLILGQLVCAVVDFGTSGLLPKEDDVVYSPKMTIDSIYRTISQPQSK
jgi:hypothetical protein